MTIKLINISKKYNEKLIFSNVNYILESNHIYGIAGSNGMGKSTLLKIIANMISPTSGQITYGKVLNKIKVDEIYKNISFCAPYIDLYQEATWLDTLKFHFKFKQILPNFTIASIIEILGFDPNLDLKSMSSGMLQRVKIVLTVFSNTNIVILDEPTETLDSEGQKWFLELIKNHSKDRIVLISSNKPSDFVHCGEIINIESYKSTIYES